MTLSNLHKGNLSLIMSMHSQSYFSVGSLISSPDLEVASSLTGSIL